MGDRDDAEGREFAVRRFGSCQRSCPESVFLSVCFSFSRKMRLCHRQWAVAVAEPCKGSTTSSSSQRWLPTDICILWPCINSLGEPMSPRTLRGRTTFSTRPHPSLSVQADLRGWLEGRLGAWRSSRIPWRDVTHCTLYAGIS